MQWRLPLYNGNRPQILARAFERGGRGGHKRPAVHLASGQVRRQYQQRRTVRTRGCV